MRKYPSDKSGFEELGKLNAAEWQIAQLKRNPNYVWWGVGEDYMCNTGEGKGWERDLVFPDWKSVDGKELDELNEIVNFYFAVERNNEECPHCGGGGYNPATREIADTFYDFEQTGKRWCDRITQDEVDALKAQGRLKYGFSENPTAWEVNVAQSKPMNSHDAINRWILIETRATRLGVWGHCEYCDGDGILYTAPTARLELNLWKIHPRKGASRGIRIETIEESDLPEVLEYLRGAAVRNAERFSGVFTEAAQS